MKPGQRLQGPRGNDQHRFPKDQAIARSYFVYRTDQREECVQWVALDAADKVVAVYEVSCKWQSPEASLWQLREHASNYIRPSRSFRNY